MNLKPGDLIARPADLLGQVVEIVEVRTAGFGWRYVPRPGVAGLAETYSSEHTDVPFFDAGWTVVLAMG